MGTLFYALNPATQQVYELGKGAWYTLAVEGVLDCSDVDRLTASVLAVMGNGWAFKDGFDVPAYAREIAESLAALRPTRLLNDSWDDLSDEEGEDLYEQVGSRYKE